MTNQNTTSNSDARSLGELLADRVAYHRDEQAAALNRRDHSTAIAHGVAAANWYSVWKDAYGFAS